VPAVRPADWRDPSPQARLRREHERAILRAIRSGLVVSRTQLAQEHGLSGQSVGRMVRGFLDDGLVEETAIERLAGSGAPRIGLRARPDGAFAFGFGLERDRVTGVILDFAGKVRWQSARGITPGEMAMSTMHAIEDEVRSVLGSPAWSGRRDRLCGLGIAVPGPIDLTTGRIIGPPNFAAWQHVELAEELSQALGLLIVVDNAATAAAVGIKWQLRHDSGPLVYCYWGLGIGGGLVVGDEAYRGTTGNSVEIGHVVVSTGGRHCECGGAGCLEAEASATAIVRDASAYGSFANVREVVAAAAGSPALAEILTLAAEKTASALLSVVNILDVDEVVMGGEHFAAVEELFLPIIRDRLASRSFRRRIAGVSVTVSTLGEAANAIGAAELVLDSVLPSVSPRRPVVVQRFAVARAGRLQGSGTALPARIHRRGHETEQQSS
jgi:predicted NBD/HSP70 family sugar kinase